MEASLLGCAVGHNKSITTSVIYHKKWYSGGTRTGLGIKGEVSQSLKKIALGVHRKSLNGKGESTKEEVTKWGKGVILRKVGKVDGGNRNPYRLTPTQSPRENTGGKTKEKVSKSDEPEN